ncbi:MAG: hypothetical protein M1368_11335 [Thaumarchaeota archaeon]|nr:hypothetical protein [Nitrososphaerota archaeon]
MSTSARIYINVTTVTIHKWFGVDLGLTERIVPAGTLTRMKENTLHKSTEDFHGYPLEEFKRMANHVFSTNSSAKRVHFAESEAFMLWLAWRGSNEYLVRHSGYVDGLESSWKICSHIVVGEILENAKHREEFRPITEEFAEEILASLVMQVQEFCVKNRLTSVGNSTSDDVQIFVEKRGDSLERKSIEVLSAMSLIQQGWKLTIRWPLKDNNMIFQRTIQLSQNCLLLINYQKLSNAESTYPPSVAATRGYIRFAKRRDRLEQQRKNRLGVLRWLATQRE